jgi:class 3 adenylate cyclase/tetratricopeptide (TPR) repeat protein
VPERCGVTGVVTVLFSDLVRSTAVLDRLGDDAGRAVLRRYLELLRGQVRAAGGWEVKSLGDGLMVAFSSPLDGLRCAVAMQAAVAAEKRTHPETSVGLRVGVHAGEPLEEEGDLFGTTVVVASRLCDRAREGQILASELVSALAGNHAGFGFRRLGRLRLKGLDSPLPVVEVASQEFPEGPSRELLRQAARPGASPLGLVPKFVGRQRELVTLEAELERAANGEPRCVLVIGEAGIGKTRLARELVDRHPDDIIALSGRAYPLGITASFGPWSEALELYLRVLSPDQIADLCGGFMDDLASLLRSVAAARGSVPDREPPRFRLLEGLAVLLGNVAELQPVVVVLDDVHLADASSWEALQYLTRNLPGASLLVVAAARPDELADQPIATQVLFGLEQDGLLTRVKLEVLDNEALAELAEAVVGEFPGKALIDWLGERSRGNIFFALGLLRALLDEGADLSAPRLRHLPESLAQRVSARLRDLDESAQSVLETLAVLGRRADLGTLPALAGAPLDVVTEALTPVVTARLVLEEERGPDVTYEITHPLVQETIYNGIIGARRRAAHRRIGRGLLAAGSLGEAAQHFARAAHIGDDEAIAVLRDAVRDAEHRQAYREALTILSSLAELLPSGDERWLDVANALSNQAKWVYRGPSQAAMGIRAMREIRAALERSPDLARRATINFRLATFLAFGTGDLEEAARACGEAVELYRQAGDRSRMLLATNELASIRALGGDITAWEAGAREVVEAAEAAGERYVMMEALGTLAIAAAHRGRFQECESAFRRNVAIASAVAKPHSLTMSLTALASCLSWEGKITEALPLLERARAVNPGWRESLFLEWGIFTYWMAGDLAAVLTNADEVGTIGKRGGHSMHFAALAAAEMGQLDRARGYLAKAQTAYGDKDWFIYTDFGLYVGAFVAWRGGVNGESLEALERVGRALLRLGVLPYAGWVLVDLVEMAAASGERDLAIAYAGHLEDIAHQIDRELYWALAGIGRAWSQLTAGDPGRAAKTASAALAALSGCGCRLFLGRALDVLGRALAGRDDTAARAALEEAVATFDTCGAVWRRDRALALLRNCDDG